MARKQYTTYCFSFDRQTIEHVRLLADEQSINLSAYLRQLVRTAWDVPQKSSHHQTEQKLPAQLLEVAQGTIRK